MVNAYAVQSGGCRFESLWGFGFSLKGAHYEVDYSGKKNLLSWTAMHIDFVMCKKGPLFHFFGTVRHFPKEKISKISSFLQKSLLRFLSLRYSADFRRSRLVDIFIKRKRYFRGHRSPLRIISVSYESFPKATTLSVSMRLSAGCVPVLLKPAPLSRISKT